MQGTEKDVKALDRALLAEGIHPNMLPAARQVVDGIRPLVESVLSRYPHALNREAEAFFSCVVRAVLWHPKGEQ